MVIFKAVQIKTGEHEYWTEQGKEPQAKFVR